MKKTGITLFLGLVLATCPAVRAQTNSLLIDGLAARVNGKPITVGDVMMFVEPVRKQLARSYSGDEYKNRLGKAFQEALASLVERRLILDAYAAQELKIPDWAVEQRITEIVHEEFQGDRAALLRALAQDRLTYEQWRDEMRDQLVVASMRQSYVGDLVTIPPQAARKAYDQNKEKYQQPAQVRLRVLELRKGETAEATAARRRRIEDMLARVRAGEDFEAIVRQNSEGSRAAEGGDTGWMDPAMCRRELIDAVAGLKAGDLGGIVETQDGWFLVRLEGRKEPAPRDFESVRMEIERELRNQEADRLYQEWVRSLRAQASIETFDVELQ